MARVFNFRLILKFYRCVRGVSPTTRIRGIRRLVRDRIAEFTGKKTFGRPAERYGRGRRVLCVYENWESVKFTGQWKFQMNLKGAVPRQAGTDFTRCFLSITRRKFRFRGMGTIYFHRGDISVDRITRFGFLLVQLLGRRERKVSAGRIK